MSDGYYMQHIIFHSGWQWTLIESLSTSLATRCYSSQRLEQRIQEPTEAGTGAAKYAHTNEFNTNLGSEELSNLAPSLSWLHIHGLECRIWCDRNSLKTSL